MSDPIRILVIVGSLRRGSYNRMLARYALLHAPPGVEFVEARIDGIPPFNEDDRTAAGEPAAVADLRAAVRRADAVLFVSPEYNRSLPGVLKNAIDWASYGREQPFTGKVAAIMGASTGRFGTTRMQVQLRGVLASLGVHVVPQPEVMVGEARDRFDEHGRLVDERVGRQVAALMEALASSVVRCRERA